ncbi:MAG: protein-L-isoaspartate(D-aspartate) O-methyltransferase [Aliidongia sp.]|nr:protein-L-isoaspartate(D-aspartate) O-methyltransferase [Aliidongia sp.]
MNLALDPDQALKAAGLAEELARAGIRDERVLAAMANVPRDLFVPPTFAEHAWDNVALPIGHGQTISQPLVVACMTEALEVGERHMVFEIGTGSGYQTAVLAQLCRRVFTIERHRALLREAERRFAQLRLGNVTSRFGDGSKGWPEAGSFDRILITAAAAEFPQALIDLLAPDGILVGPLGPERQDQILVRIRRDADGTLVREELCAVRFVPLVPGLPREPARRGKEET